MAQRSNMLWRIAQANEHDQPKTSIAAIAELNKVDIAFREMETSANRQQAPIIIMNQESLPRTALDVDKAKST
jgi:hypothetical protein